MMSSHGGDLNQDGVLDHLDLALLKQVVQEFKTHGAESSFIKSLSPEQLGKLDINQDGKIDYDDVVALCHSLIHQPNTSDSELRQGNDRFNALRAKLNA